MNHTQGCAYAGRRAVDDELCLARRVRAAEINQLLFQTVDHECVGFILTRAEI